jgi:hypothetical protein
MQHARQGSPTPSDVAMVEAATKQLLAEAARRDLNFINRNRCDICNFSARPGEKEQAHPNFMMHCTVCGVGMHFNCVQSTQHYTGSTQTWVCPRCLVREAKATAPPLYRLFWVVHEDDHEDDSLDDDYEVYHRRVYKRPPADTSEELTFRTLEEAKEWIKGHYKQGIVSPSWLKRYYITTSTEPDPHYREHLGLTTWQVLSCCSEEFDAEEEKLLADIQLQSDAMRELRSITRANSSNNNNNNNSSAVFTDREYLAFMKALHSG